MSKIKEILFRGKRLYDGEWVYGGYFNDNGSHFIPLGIGAAFVEVEQETVGQFTGIKDTDNNKIFEGDIVTVYEVLGQQGIMEPFEGVVKYGNGYYYVEHINERNRKGTWNLSSCWLVVVGNIHDNNDLYRKIKGE